MSLNITGSIFYPGSSSLLEVVSFSAFGFYNSDTTYISESVSSTVWAVRRLGYPSIDIELSNEQFVTYFEEAVNEYSAQINSFNIKEHLLTLQGSPTSSNLTGKEIRGSLGGIVKLSEQYGAEVGAGGDITWHTGSIPVATGTQLYYLNALFAVPSASGRDIRIKKIFHQRTPASVRYFDPWGLPTAPGSYNMGFFGFGSELGGTVGGVGATYVLRPVYEDLLRMQAIELNDQVRKSAYSFEIINNQLRLFPIPQSDFTLFFQYVFKDESDVSFDTSSLGKITDPSNVPYDTITYSYINSVGRQWIRNYFLAICKISLGGIRGKYPNIPIPDAEVSLDGESMRAEGINERDKLIEQLQQMLEKTSRRSQMESKNDIDENMNKILGKFPLPIYIR